MINNLDKMNDSTLNLNFTKYGLDFEFVRGGSYDLLIYGVLHKKCIYLGISNLPKPLAIFGVDNNEKNKIFLPIDSLKNLFYNDFDNLLSIYSNYWLPLELIQQVSKMKEKVVTQQKVNSKEEINKNKFVKPNRLSPDELEKFFTDSVDEIKNEPNIKKNINNESKNNSNIKVNNFYSKIWNSPFIPTKIKEILTSPKYENCLHFNISANEIEKSKDTYKIKMSYIPENMIFKFSGFDKISEMLFFTEVDYSERQKYNSVHFEIQVPLGKVLNEQIIIEPNYHRENPTKNNKFTDNKELNGKNELDDEILDLLKSFPFSQYLI